MKKLFLQVALALGLLGAQLLHAAIAGDRPVAPSLTLASPTLEIGFPVTRSLIQFFYVNELGQEPNIEIYLSHRSGDGIRTVHLETIEPEGRAARIESVFTLNVDGSNEYKLFIIAAWPVRHTSIETYGTYYKVYVYRKTASAGG